MDKQRVTLGVRSLPQWWVWLLGMWLLAACHYPAPDLTRWELSRSQRDSLHFCYTHHYGPNYNFKVTADSLLLKQVLRPDSLAVRRGDVLVVADYARAQQDSAEVYWIKVARDQDTMGWIPETELLRQVVPVDPISQCIRLFSGWRTVVVLVVGGLFVLFYLYRRAVRRSWRLPQDSRVDSIYPTLFCLMVVVAATLYAGIQRFVPETWVHYYYHPSLNPLGLPGVLSCLVISVWLLVLTALALVDDLFHQVDFSTAFFYLLGLGTLGLFLYLFVTWAVYYYVGYALLPVFVYMACRRMAGKASGGYRCGHCGTTLHHLGVCPRCGYLNK